VIKVAVDDNGGSRWSGGFKDIAIVIHESWFRDA
jgi:hypothetical protein